MKNFRATIDGVGDWARREEYAVRRWNTLVMPTIDAAIGAAIDIAKRSGDYFYDMERISYAVQKAWEAFCTEGGSRQAVRAFKKHAGCRA